MIPVFLQVLPLLSGVMYAVQAIPEKWQWILSFNPMTAVISGLALGGGRRDRRPISGQVARRRRRRGRPLRRRSRRLPVVRAALRGHDLMPIAIEAEGLSKRYRLGEFQAAYGTLRESLVARRSPRHGQGAPARRRGDLGARRRLVRASRRARCSASSAATAPASRRCSRCSRGSRRRRAGRVEIRGRVGSLLEVGTGFHPELTGRENIYLNGAILGMKRREIQPKLRRHRRVLGGRAVPRHAGEALLERHVRAARVLGRGAPRAGDPARRRGARRRRRGVPDALPRAHGGLRRDRPHRALRLAQHAGGRAALRPRDPPRERPGRRWTARASDVVAHYLQTSAGAGSSRTWDDLETRPATTSCGCARCGSSTRDGETVDYVDVREPVGIEIAFRVLRDGPAGPAEDQARRRRAHRLQRHGRRPALARAVAARASTSRPRGSPATSSTRASCRSTRPSARSLAEAPPPRERARGGRRSTCRIRARATRRAAPSPVSGAASCVRCSSGRASAWPSVVVESVACPMPVAPKSLPL